MSKQVFYYVSFYRGYKEVFKKMTYADIVEKSVKFKWAKGALRAADELNEYAADPIQAWCHTSAARYGSRLNDLVGVKRVCYTPIV